MKITPILLIFFCIQLLANTSRAVEQHVIKTEAGPKISYCGTALQMCTQDNECPLSEAVGVIMYCGDDCLCHSRNVCGNGVIDNAAHEECDGSDMLCAPGHVCNNCKCELPQTVIDQERLRLHRKLIEKQHLPKHNF